jgi:hypothetical protein
MSRIRLGPWQTLVSICLTLPCFIGLAQSQELGAIQAPPKGSSFTFEVKATGYKAATMSLWQAPGEGLEVHTLKGLIRNVKGRSGSQTLEQAPPYNCLDWEITKPNDPKFRGEYLYAIVDNALCCYLERQSSGEEKYYVKPLVLFRFPLRPENSFKNNTTFYLHLPDTGITLAKSYTSKGATTDTIEAEVLVGQQERIATKAGTFPATKVTVKFRSHTGRFLTSANTTITMERWWSEKLGYFIREHDDILMDALIDSKGTIDKELVSFRLPSP